MLTLWGRNSAVGVKKVIWCLTELDFPYENIQIGGKAGGLEDPDFLRLNPHGKIPVLKDGDRVVWESNTILRYLASRAPDCALLPQELGANAQVNEWLDWQLGTLWPDFVRICEILFRTAPEQRNESDLAAIQVKLDRKIKALDEQLRAGPYLCGKAFTIADISIGIVALTYNLFADDRIDPYENYRKWCTNLAQREACRVCAPSLPQKMFGA